MPRLAGSRDMKWADGATPIIGLVPFPGEEKKKEKKKRERRYGNETIPTVVN